jgi:hypothetical protein
MTPTELPDNFDDVEKPHPLVAEMGDGGPSEPLVVRLGDLWNDFLRAKNGEIDHDSMRRSTSAMPLLDDMKGIMQWD